MWNLKNFLNEIDKWIGFWLMSVFCFFFLSFFLIFITRYFGLVAITENTKLLFSQNQPNEFIKFRQFLMSPTKLLLHLSKNDISWNNFNHVIDIIVLSEIWIFNYEIEHFKISNYKFVLIVLIYIERGDIVECVK